MRCARAGSRCRRTEVLRTAGTPAASTPEELAGRLVAEAATVQSEIDEIELLISQAKTEAARHETLGAMVESGSMPPAVSRLVLSVQEDLRREIARSMHDGPAQSLTNIVLQAQIVDRLLARDPEQAAPEVQALIGMVQRTLEATKTFIFDVRPMVLDDLGLVPTLRKASRERGRRANVKVDFESIGGDRRLP